MSPCRTCSAECCQYVALQIDTPRSKDEFEYIRWYLAHKKIVIFVEKRKWYLEIRTACRHLAADHKCTIYNKRPTICREHTPHDCEFHGGEFSHEYTFHSLEEFDDYLKERKKKRQSKGKKVRVKKSKS